MDGVEDGLDDVEGEDEGVLDGWRDVEGAVVGNARDMDIDELLLLVVVYPLLRLDNLDFIFLLKLDE